MSLCGVDRRELLRWTAAASGAVALEAGRLESARAQQAPPVAPQDLELVTLTETSAVFTWYTGVPGTADDVGRNAAVPTDGAIRIGVSPDRLDRVVGGGAETPHHYIEVTGLEPQRTYYYQAVSAGVPATPTALVDGLAAGTGALGPAGPFSFTTPAPPPGRHLFTIALCNDLHLGETVAGKVSAVPQIPGIAQLPGKPPYPRVMAQAMVADAVARGAKYLLVAGDLTAEAAPADDAVVKSILDGFGGYQREYWVVRGNHDRAHAGADYAGCKPGRWQGNDCFGDRFFDGKPSWFVHELHGLRIIGLDTYDKPGNGGDAGGLSPQQLSWFTAELRRRPHQPTLVFGHHPLVTEADPLAVSGRRTLAPDQVREILAAYRDCPGVFLHHAGHTHRNRHAVLPGLPTMLHQEIGAVKEYPGGFSLLRIHSGGFALNFYKTRSADARAWSERSRRELGGLWPQLSLGSRVTDRNAVFPLTGLS
ncbi:MAG: metallophosphoesterase family protein [Mycobacteriaceae bacterium]|nr:metallophosphoesterase family protein [Mycobacteriaceae bacterium]